MEIHVANPLDRAPLALIIDDSCPLINLGAYWIEQRHAWREKHHPGTPPGEWEGDPSRLATLGRTIPTDFLKRWGDWCGEHGIKGKFSVIPVPAGLGRIDQKLPGVSRAQLDAWLDVARDVIQPNFDITPEMLTHTHVLDLKTMQLTDAWEQVEWVDPPVEMLFDYISLALQILKNVGIQAEGVTSPGAFAKKQEAAYARAVMDAAREVNGVTRPFYFLWLKNDEWPDVPLWYADKAAGTAIASIVSCSGDFFGGWTGYDGAGQADLMISQDGQSGRLPQVLERGLPCISVGHWPGFYFDGAEVGFNVLKEVKRRLERFDPDATRTLWMTISEIRRYEMARQLCDISVSTEGSTEGEAEVVTIDTQFLTDRFTLELDAPLRRVAVNGSDLREVGSKRNFANETWMREGKRTLVAFDLGGGRTQVRCWKA